MGHLAHMPTSVPASYLTYVHSERGTEGVLCSQENSTSTADSKQWGVPRANHLSDQHMLISKQKLKYGELKLVWEVSMHP